jgi:DNA-binding response OmpR family regulator
MSRVALAEDDVDTRNLMVELLQEHGLDVVEASDGETLLGLLEQIEVAVVVTDLWMPGLDGNDVLHRRRDAGDKTPFIVLTAAPVACTASLVGADGVMLLRKPFTVDELVRSVETALASCAALPVARTAPGVTAAPSAAPSPDSAEGR